MLKKKKERGLCSLTAILIFLTGCTITQEVDPLDSSISREICIIENSAVRSGFLVEYKKNLNELGYQIKVLPEGSQLDDCLYTSTYLGHWSWDWFWSGGVYMSLAEIKVYKEGKLIGEAIFDSTSGSARMGRIIDAEPKIKELVEELFPPHVSPSLD